MLENKTLSSLPFATLSGWTEDSGEYWVSKEINPLNVIDDDVELTRGTVGSLAAGEWGFADGKIYVKDDPTASVMKCSEPHLLSNIIGKDIIALALHLANTDDADANVVLIISDGFSVNKAIQLLTLETTSSPDVVKAIVLNSFDRVEIMSNKENVNALMSVSYTEV